MPNYLSTGKRLAHFRMIVWVLVLLNLELYIFCDEWGMIMGCVINIKEYEKMVDEDVEWLLSNLPPCPQRDRIVGVIKAIEENAKELRARKTCKNIGV